MAVSCVHFEGDVFMVCLAHAFSTEREEVMGLLIGEITENRVSHISTVLILRRSDKRKDRVEISPEQLSAAATRAEILTHQLQRPMRVLGWYHSHPHITVWPSHVDVQTQAMYQLMDKGFIGVIFSVFNEDKVSKFGKVQVTCFQASNQSKPEPIEIPLYIVDTRMMSGACAESLVELPKILHEEEQNSHNSTYQVKDLITTFHNNAVFTKAVCHQFEILSGPMMQTLENRLICNNQKIVKLLETKEELQKQLLSLQGIPTNL